MMKFERYIKMCQIKQIIQLPGKEYRGEVALVLEGGVNVWKYRMARIAVPIQSYCYWHTGYIDNCVILAFKSNMVY